MTIDEILKTVNVLNDYSTENFFGLLGIILGAIGTAVFVFSFISSLVAKNKEGIIFIILALFTSGLTLFAIWSYVSFPYYVNIYISTNGVKIEQITEYFEINQLSEVEEMTVCRITPKSEYYDEIVEAYRTSVRKGTEL